MASPPYNENFSVSSTLASVRLGCYSQATYVCNNPSSCGPISQINVEAERFRFIMDPCGNYCESLALAGLSTICIVLSVRDIHRKVEIEKAIASAQHHYAFEKKVLVRRIDRPVYGDASMP